ncbi:aldehyde dehydrogenase family protein [Cryobacterium suzukii]|uniref:aldehyde dehydrogenase (NAD(+)) n=1 Tax=Cryobacterium suzukii TaxID=1259198 RepID=A0A4R9AI37_9MICO|nr:aldehyde dehydrogenase family protein [Cryobacterium suzukii]TFD62177.1 aldehyde dehydrogenase family protein [Cryobacterium suzukii]
MQVINDIYVNGAFVPSTGTERTKVINPATEEIVADLPQCSVADTEAAIAAAKAAFPAWSALAPAERSNYLTRIYEGLLARREEIASIASQEMGMPYLHALAWQADLPISNFQYYADLAATYDFDHGSLEHSLIVREPIGVIGVITPWNFPLHQIALKVAPALAAGCTVVLKPSEVAPLTGFILAEVVHAAGLPAGVFNLVLGKGAEIGEVLASSPDVDMVSLTGSTRAGIRVSELASRSVKRVSLELGGKSANIILDGADLEAAVNDGVSNVLFNSGQACAALTRMLVPRSRLAEVEEIAKRAVAGAQLGDPLAETTTMGPIVTKAQQEKVLEYIRIGQQEGAKLIVGGADPVSEVGYFVAPTVFSEVGRSMRIAREEIFGPVLAILPYDNVEEGIDIANDSDYGLSGSVWAGTTEAAIAVARRLRTGQVAVSGGGFNSRAPFGGYKTSGNGREAGLFGLEEFLEVKSIQGAAA